MRIILLGPPGAGKGTQSKFLADYFKIAHIVTGDMLRQAIQSKTPLGRKIKASIEAGFLASDDIMIDMVVERLSALGCQKGFVLDGYPRTLLQAEALRVAKISIDYVINLEVSDDELIERVSGRRVHIASGRTYHVVYNPPRVKGQDDETGEPLVLRKEDEPVVIRRRLKIYHEKIRPIVDFYRKLGNETKFLIADGRGTIKKIQKNILKKIT